jgi:hypothetical protein
MMALLSLAFQDIWKPAAIVGGILIVVGGIYLKGHSDGSASADQAAKTAVFNQIKERNITDEKVKGMSDPDLCRALGGVWHDDGCQ